jgi:hypothetical protein
MDGLWPSKALEQQAGSIGPAVLDLMDAETEWVHRRVEHIDLLDTTQMTRTVAVDLTVPLARQGELALYANEGERGKAPARQFVLPLGVLPKEHLQDVAMSPPEVHRMTAAEGAPIIVAGVEERLGRIGADPDAVALATTIVTSEDHQDDELRRFNALVAGDGDAVRELRELVATLNTRYVLLVVMPATVGVPLRIGYVHRQVFSVVGSGRRLTKFAAARRGDRQGEIDTAGEPKIWPVLRQGKVNEPPFTLEVPLFIPSRSRMRPTMRVEVVAPEGLEIERASIDDAGETVLDAKDTGVGGGAFVQLLDSGKGSAPATLRVVFAFPNGGIHQVAMIAGVTSTVALLVAFALSFFFRHNLTLAGPSALLAAPALVTGIVLGFASTRLTARPVNRLRLVAFFIALTGVAAGLVIVMAPKDPFLEILLGALLVVSAWLTGWWPWRAAWRKRAVTE